MKSIKIIIFSLVTVLFAFICVACQNNFIGNDNQSSNLTTTDEKNSSHSNNSNNADENENIEIHINNSGIWTKEECSKAEKFANAVIKSVKNKDINALSDMISYPISLIINNNKIEINNKSEFIDLGSKKVFTEDLIKMVSNTTKLFSNQYGFMIGNTPAIWFSPMEDGSIGITQIIYS